MQEGIQEIQQGKYEHKVTRNKARKYAKIVRKRTCEREIARNNPRK